MPVSELCALRLELAKRRASKFAMDNAETQPLPPSLSDAVASAGALALTPSPDHAGAVQEMMPTDDGCDDGLRRSLQRQFSAEEHLGVADGSQEATPVGGVADGSQEAAPVDHGLEGAVPDHELGLVPNPVEDQLGDLVAKADEAPMAACDALDQMPDHVPPSVEKELDCQLIEDAFVEKQQAVPTPANPETTPSVEALCSAVPAPSQPVNACEGALMAGGCDDEPMLEDENGEMGEMKDEKMVVADEISDGGEDDEEPPVVPRRDQWSLRPAPKPRGRKPKAAAKAKEAKPKTAPRTGGRKNTRKFITIDDIVPPTPAPPAVAADGNGAVPPKAVEKKQPRKRAAKAKASGSKKKRQASAASEGEKPLSAKDKEDEKNKIVWTHVSKEAAPVVAGNLKWAPVQDKAVDDKVLPEAPKDDAAEPMGSSGSSGHVEKPKTDGPGSCNDDRREGDAKGGGKGDAKAEHVKSFARRFIPKLTPARERWLAVRDVFNQHVKDCIEELGFKPYPVEARDFLCAPLVFKHVDGDV